MKNLFKLKNDKSAELNSYQREKQKIKIETKAVLLIEKIKETVFWNKSNGSASKINHSELMKFFSLNGFYKLRMDNNLIVIRDDNNRIEEVSDDDLIEFIKKYLIQKNEDEVLEVFTKGVSSYLSPRKMSFLDSTMKIEDRDGKDDSKIFFNNCYVFISKEGIKIKDYKDLNAKIWKSRILKRDFNFPKNDEKGQFEQFCFNISKKNSDRFLSLQTIIGYLLHRNKERGEVVAIILYDELMNSNGETNGRTGKTLISNAINELREVVAFDGKNMKKNSWFKFQRVNITTDVLNFDDLNKATSIEEFYSILTTGIEIEKKRKDAVQLNVLDSPKVMLSSNHIIKGPGGPSDDARRHEFELANYYNASFTPEREFKNRFFGNYWKQEEWDKFYHFMMKCILIYINNGLIKADSINFKEATIIDKTNIEFYDWMKENITLNKNVDKRAFKTKFIKDNQKFSNISEHIFAKWLIRYSIHIKAEYSVNSTGGDYYFKISKS